MTELNNPMFYSGQTLEAVQLNIIVSKINEIINYINNQGSSQQQQGTQNPINEQPTETEENKSDFADVTIPELVYNSTFANTARFIVNITKSKLMNGPWSTFGTYNIENTSNVLSMYLPKEDTITYYKLAFIDANDGGNYWADPNIIIRQND